MSSTAAVLEAVRARLEGKDPDYVAPVFGRSITQQTASLERSSPEAVVAFYQRKTWIEPRGVRVPVLFKGHEGYGQSRVWPSLAFDVMGPSWSPTGASYIPHATKYGGTRFFKPYLPSMADVYDEDGGFLRQAARQAVVTKPPISVKWMLEVRALARDSFTMGILVDYVFRTLPPRHYLRVANMDGTYQSSTLELTDTQDLDSRKAVVEGAIERENTFVWTYEFAGFLDETFDARFVNLVRKRVIAVTNKGDE